MYSQRSTREINLSRDSIGIPGKVLFTILDLCRINYECRPAQVDNSFKNHLRMGQLLARNCFQREKILFNYLNK